MDSDFGRIVDALPGLVWTALPDGQADFLNQRWCEYTGLSMDQAIREGWQVAVHPDDLARLLDYWLPRLAAGAEGEIEARLRRHDGAYRWFLFRFAPVRDAEGRIVKWCGINTDIDDLKQAEDAAHAHEALRASERNLRETINALPALVFCNRADGPNEFLNQRWHDYTGLTVEQTRGNGWQSALHPDDLPRLMDKWMGMLKMREFGEVEGRLRGCDGAYRWFLFRTEPLRDESGKVVKWYGTCTDIEDRKQAEGELRRALGHLTEAQRLSLTGSFTADMIRDEHIWSDELYRIFEVGPATKVTIQLARDLTHPDDLPVFDDAVGRAVAGATDHVDFVGRIVLPSGTVKHLRYVGHRMQEIPDRPVFVGAIADVTAAKLTEEALRRSEAFLAQGEAVSETGSFLWRLDENQIRWSEQLYHIFEIELGTPITLEAIAARVHPEDIPAMEQMIVRARAGRASEYEHRALMPDGRIKHLHFVAQPTLDDEGRPAYMGSVQDVSERRLSEQVLSKVRYELAHVARVSSLGALTASIAHEVNQPLAGIVTNASTCLRMLAADPPNIEGARETARRTIRDGNRASEVIKRLRELFAKKEASLEAMDLNQAVQEVLALSVNELQRSRVILRQEFANDLPQVAGDRVQLQQVILNLILNAADAMSDVQDRQRQLVIRTRLDEDDHVRFDVQDSGAGIDPQHAPKLFDAFYTTKPNGMGIGLSVSRSIIERHQGRLWVRANDGPGATFSFAIPRGGSEQTEVARQH